MEERKGSADIQEEIRIPADIQEEITKLRKREKFLSYAVATFLLVGAFLGFKVFFAGSALAQYENYDYSQVQAAPLGVGTGADAGAGGGGGGCCGGGGGGGPTLPAEELQVQSLELYKQETGKSDVDAQVSDRGCHTQIDIVDSSGAIVKSYGYKGGNEVYPII